MRILRYGDSAVLVEVDDVLGLQAACQADPPEGVVELVPAARTLLVQFDPARTDAATISRALSELSIVEQPTREADTVTLSVRYDGADLADVADATGYSVEEVVRRHSSGTYVAAFCGFAPGFAYLTGLDPQLHLPRRSTPRTRVPAGAVAIAGEYTAVYPHPSPGGWLLLGHTDAPVWNVERPQPNLLSPGTQVRFEVLD